MGKGKKGGGEDTRGMKAKAQKKAALDAKMKVKADQKAAHIAQDWERGANSRSKARADQAHEAEVRREAAKAAKQAALAADAADLASMRVKPGKARKAAKAKKNDLSALEMFLSPQEKAQLKAKSTTVPKTKSVQNDPLLQPNMNRAKAEAEASGVFEASGVDAALSALELAGLGGSTGGAEEDRNPTKRGKALYMAFEERKMAELREEYPSLKRSQLKDRIWKEWQKAPENPFRDLA